MVSMKYVQSNSNAGISVPINDEALMTPQADQVSAKGATSLQQKTFTDVVSSSDFITAISNAVLILLAANHRDNNSNMSLMVCCL